MALKCNQFTEVIAELSILLNTATGFQFFEAGSQENVVLFNRVVVLMALKHDKRIMKPAQDVCRHKDMCSCTNLKRMND